MKTTKDFLGNEIQVGDYVAYWRYNTGEPQMGLVQGISRTGNPQVRKIRDKKLLTWKDSCILHGRFVKYPKEYLTNIEE